MQRRVQALLLVVALFAAPLALLARASMLIGGACNNLCCLPHGSHAGVHSDSQDSEEKGMACHHGSDGHAMSCFMRAGHHPLDYGLLAPFPPTTISAFISAPVPVPSRSTLAGTSQPLLSGFTSAPFQPPRS